MNKTAPQLPHVTRSQNVEWPTAGLLAMTYLCFAAATWFYDVLPWFIVLPVGGYLVCLFGSLQHEAVHGHPFRSSRLNEALVFPALGLWMPYRRYKALHIAHHNDDSLTDPADDPESYYWTKAQWGDVPPLLRPVLRFNNTLLGRLSIGPAIAVAFFIWKEARLMIAGDGRALKAWLLHGLGTALALYWIIGICNIPFWHYVLLYAYPGLSLTLLRSFAEHRAHLSAGGRTAVLEAGPLMSLLYLNNNLHAAHHDVPSLPWYGLPRHYRANRDKLLQRNNGYLLNGYGGLFRRYLLRAKEPTIHPLIK